VDDVPSGNYAISSMFHALPEEEAMRNCQFLEEQMLGASGGAGFGG
jgi:hypothetical protein